jgi:hypothetical protein
MPAIWLSPSLYEPRGRQLALTWELFAVRASNPRPAKSKEGLARWAPVEFRGGHRRLAGVLRAHAVVVDVDDGSSLQKITDAFRQLYIIVHSTFSATAEKPRWRVIFPLDRPVDGEGYDRVYRWLAMRLEEAGAKPDFGARDASHAWAVPARPPSGFYVCRVIDGAYLDTATAFAVIPKAQPLPEPAQSEHSQPYDRRLERARRYLATMPGGIQGSGGSTTTFKAALAMVRGFGLEPDDALRLLLEVHNPMCAPPWSERELQHKVRQAHQRARVPFGAIADRGRAA